VEHRLPYARTAPGIARKITADFVSDRLPAARSDEVVMMVSEIVGNAVRHGEPELDGRIGLRLQGDDSVIRVTVLDGAPGFTFDRRNLDQTNGPHLGLMMVDTLADRWGFSVEGQKAVWFEVDSPAA
jgi:serine/threonine-protein kinase RsbW